MKIKAAISNILTSKTTLYVVAALSLFNLIGYLVLGNTQSVLFFIVFAGLSYCFSKNMVIVLGIPLVLVNLIGLKRMKEGMENSKKPDTSSSASASSSSNKTNSVTKPSRSNDKPEAKTKQGLPMHPIAEKKEEEQQQQGFSTGAGKNRSRGHEIDYATTVEEAYDNLNSILGGEGIQQLTADSQNLMKQQLQLAEAMKGMGPVLQSIAPMVENLKGMMGNDKNGLGGMMDLAKKMTQK